MALVPAFSAFADTPTSTATPTSTITMTPTPALGEGQWSMVVNSGSPVVTGQGGYSGVFNYTAGPTAWPSTGGLLSVYFPFGIDTPSPSNFYAAPAFSSNIRAYGFSGQTVTVQIANLAPGAGIDFYYGYNPTGFAVSTTNTPLDLYVASNAVDISYTLMGGVTPNPANTPIVVQTPTCTPTATITTSPSESPTSTPSPSVTPTWTESPVGNEHAGTVYTYPNPFNLQNFNKCTFRFGPASNVHVTVFNLVGEPVREIPSSDINEAQGWAIWPGVDDYMRKVTGGMYFVRVRSSSGTLTKKFTVLN